MPEFDPATGTWKDSTGTPFQPTNGSFSDLPPAGAEVTITNPGGGISKGIWDGSVVQPNKDE